MPTRKAAAGHNPPRPPDHLIHRVHPLNTNEITEDDRIGFDGSGQRSLRELLVALASVDKELRDFRRILDFGCGCARVTRWYPTVVDDSELHGCDIDELAIAWNSENLPFATFVQNAGEPPLPYSDGYFDLVVNHSVFTHLDEHYQDMWLQELQRIVEPGGLLVLSVHGERAFQIAEEQSANAGENPGTWRRVLEEKGILFIADDSYVGGPFPDFYHTTFHAPWYIFTHWSKWFDIRSYIPFGDLGHQDIVILERRPLNSPAPRPLMASPGQRVAPQVGQSSPPELTPPWKTYAQRVLRRLTESVATSDAGNRAPVAEAEAEEGDSLDRIPVLVRVILADQGERLRRLESAVFGKDSAGTS